MTLNVPEPSTFMLWLFALAGLSLSHTRTSHARDLMAEPSDGL